MLRHLHTGRLGGPVVALTLTLIFLLGGCTSATSTSVGGSVTPTTSGGTKLCDTSPNNSDCQLGPGIQNAQLFVEPEAGDKPVVDAIKSAKTTITLEIYELTETNVIDALENAAHRGVKVSVLLEMFPAGQVTPSPDQTAAKLQAAGVTVKATNPAYRFTHAKTMVIDQQTALISSANYTKAALGGSSFSTDRDYIVVDTLAPDVQECVAIFTADWNRVFPSLSDVNLVVSPVNSRPKWLALIQSAKSTLELEQEEMEDSGIIDALLAAAKRGVKVGVVVPKPASNSTEATTEAQLQAGGVQVNQIDDRATGGLYIHAKIIVADQTLAFVGSENVSGTSLDSNREIGLLIASPAIIQQLSATFAQDFGRELG